MTLKRWLFFLFLLILPGWGATFGTIWIVYNSVNSTLKENIWVLIVAEVAVSAYFTLDGYRKTKSGYFSREGK